MKCIISHEITTETGFKVFEAGADYPPEETLGREKYFAKEAAPAVEEKPPEPETEPEKPPRKGRKLNEEVEK